LRLLEIALDSAETDEECAAIARECLANIEEVTVAKIDNYAALIRSKMAEAKAAKTEEEFFKDRRKRAERAVDKLKDGLLYYMTMRGFDRQDTRRFTISRCDNGGVLPLELDVSPENLPEEFQRVTYHADQDSIREALEQGTDLTFARFGERGKHIRIS
jgi:hypothetical protein